MNVLTTIIPIFTYYDGYVNVSSKDEFISLAIEICLMISFCFSSVFVMATICDYQYFDRNHKVVFWIATVILFASSLGIIFMLYRFYQSLP